MQIRLKTVRLWPVECFVFLKKINLLSALYNVYEIDLQSVGTATRAACRNNKRNMDQNIAKSVLCSSQQKHFIAEEIGNKS